MNVIDQRIHQVLDGELAAEAVPAELRRAVAQLAAAADLLAVPPAGAVTSLESRVMAELGRPAPSRARRVMRWLVTPHALLLRGRPAPTSTCSWWTASAGSPTTSRSAWWPMTSAAKTRSSLCGRPVDEALGGRCLCGLPGRPARRPVGARPAGGAHSE